MILMAELNAKGDSDNILLKYVMRKHEAHLTTKVGSLSFSATCNTWDIVQEQSPP